MSSTLSVDAVRVEHHPDGFGIGQSTPRLSWTVTAPPESAATDYRIRVEGPCRDSVTTPWTSDRGHALVDWPAAPLRSREQVQVGVQLRSADGARSAWNQIDVEAALLARSDWATSFVSPSVDAPAGALRPGYLLRAEFDVPEGVTAVRAYASAHGVYELEVNGQSPSRELLAPGWTSYRHRLRYQSYELDQAVQPGRNAIGAWLADGWYRGRLGFDGGLWDIYGRDAALLLQLELHTANGDVVAVPLRWRSAASPITAVGLYEGETYDARLLPEDWSRPGFDDSTWVDPTLLPLSDFPAELEPPSGPPVRVTETLMPVAVRRMPTGRIRYDFGQNISGRLRLSLPEPAAGQRLVLTHAEVLEDGELALRPLRTAVATDTYITAGHPREQWAPRFTIHGFRYAEIDGWTAEVDNLEVVAEVVHSDMRRIGWFACSNDLLERLHHNVVWSMRDNFVDLPTDCPQRDERLGWTGDIQVFTPTAAYLYDCAGILQSWLRDLSAEQGDFGYVPNFVPWVECGFPADPSAGWGDAAVIVPWVLYERTGDTRILAEQLDSMKDWVEFVWQRGGRTGRWDRGFQLGDWLDPAAPPDRPGDARTDRYLVADAYFVRSADLLARTLHVLGLDDEHARYADIHRQAMQAFRDEYVTPAGRLVSDTPTAIALALEFDLLAGAEQRSHAGRRLVELVIAGDHKITTGFLGTPIICDALVAAGGIDTAYHLLLQENCPSWLYQVLLGATTVWERWDSMLPDGTVNPGNMTSFNHYALGAVADFMHRHIAGLSPAAPGYRQILIAPRPGGNLTWASARHLTPQGLAEVSWHRDGSGFHLDVEIPFGSTGRVLLPGADSEQEIGPGRHHFSTALRAPEDDPPAPELARWAPPKVEQAA